MKILVINGPNINMLGIREKNIYGAETYEDLKALLEKTFAEKGVEGEIYQSNHEGWTASSRHILTAQREL